LFSLSLLFFLLLRPPPTPTLFPYTTLFRSGMLHGRGVAYARYTHSRFPGFGAAWNAWVVDVSVHAATGRVVVTRVVVGQDTGMRSEEHTSELQSRENLVCRLLLEKKNNK